MCFYISILKCQMPTLRIEVEKEFDEKFVINKYLKVIADITEKLS